MKLTNLNMIQIAVKNIKDKSRHWQYLFFSLGLPIMFTVMFYFIIGKENYEYGLPGMIIYATGVGAMSAAIAFANEKNSGMLIRLDTMPTGRKNIFLGTLISESLFLTLQIIIMFIIGYGILGVNYKNLLTIFIGFFIAIIFGIASVGLGIIIASLSKTVEIANAASLMIFMILIFLSGSLIPFESPMVYFTPPFWAKQVFLQISVLGHGLNDFLYTGSMIETTSEITLIPLWGGILIIIAYTLLFIVIGIVLFQKKTKF